jgi:hypothetical protein
MAEKCLQEVHHGQPLLAQLLKVLTQGLQLDEVLPSHSSPMECRGMGRPLVNVGSGAEASFLR